MAAIEAALPAATLRGAVLFDVYRPKPLRAGEAAPAGGLAPGEKSLAVRLTLGSDAATLAEAEIETAVQAVVEQLATRTGAKLRV
jgi:phenylalanyl-tRNA synthetase beta chain